MLSRAAENSVAAETCPREKGRVREASWAWERQEPGWRVCAVLYRCFAYWIFLAWCGLVSYSPQLHVDSSRLSRLVSSDAARFGACATLQGSRRRLGRARLGYPHQIPSQFHPVCLDALMWNRQMYRPTSQSGAVRCRADQQVRSDVRETEMRRVLQRRRVRSIQRTGSSSLAALTSRFPARPRRSY